VAVDWRGLIRGGLLLYKTNHLVRW